MEEIIEIEKRPYRQQNDTLKYLMVVKKGLVHLVNVALVKVYFLSFF